MCRLLEGDSEIELFLDPGVHLWFMASSWWERRAALSLTLAGLYSQELIGKVGEDVILVLDFDMAPGVTSHRLVFANRK